MSDMKEFCSMTSILIEGKQANFHENGERYKAIETINTIFLNEEEQKIFIDCSMLLGGLNNLINSELVQYIKDGINCLESVIPLVSFREWVLAISNQDYILNDEDISVFKHLFEATATWKSCGCDLIRISALTALHER